MPAPWFIVGCIDGNTNVCKMVNIMTEPKQNVYLQYHLILVSCQSHVDWCRLAVPSCINR
jgi:hypothetical protein